MCILALNSPFLFCSLSFSRSLSRSSVIIHNCVILSLGILFMLIYLFFIKNMIHWMRIETMSIFFAYFILWSDVMSNMRRDQSKISPYQAHRRPTEGRKWERTTSKGKPQRIGVDLKVDCCCCYRSTNIIKVKHQGYTHTLSIKRIIIFGLNFK